MTDIAYLSKGKLFVCRAGGEARELTSRFAENAQRRATSSARKNAWKTQGRGARFMMGLGAAVEPEEVLGDVQVPARITGLARGRAAGEILYTLSTGAVDGLFACRIADGEEQRLFHSADFHVEQVATHPEGEVVACILRGKAGAHVAVMRPDGRGLRELTEGDTIDGAPAWAPTEGNALVYHSAGIGRDSAGGFAALGPAAIHRFDLDRAVVSCMAEDPEFDLSSPRMAADGTLHFLRRPRARATVSPFRLLLGIALIPFLLLVALFHYLNFFSARYSGKPLLRAGSESRRQADLRRMLVNGNLMNAAAAEPELPEVDASWQLVRRGPDGAETTIARGVLCFDLAPDGTVVYSNGPTLRRVSPDGTTEVLVRGGWIESVVLVESAPAVAQSTG